MNKPIGTIYLTDEFDKFELMQGNRLDAEERAKKIAESVMMAGKYIHAPIIVTDVNMQTNKHPIADGQARFTYCKDTGTPIAYCVVPGLTINDCVAMNASTSNWKLTDYIDSYAARGVESYVLTDKFIKESPFTLSTSLWALFHTSQKNKTEDIKNGTLEVTEEMFSEGMDMINFWRRFDDIPSNRKKEFLIAIGYCYLMECVDNEMLVRKVHQRPRDFMTIATVTDAIGVIEDAYNMRIRDHVYIETEYFKWLDGKAGNNKLGALLREKVNAKQEKMNQAGLNND